MISFVCWKWQTAGTARVFESAHVNVLYAMVARNYKLPFRLICITDDTAGLDPHIESLSLPVRFDELSSPQGRRFPSCYCRLWSFSTEARMLGERILCIDLDCVIIGNLEPLLDRDGDFVGWCDERSDAGRRIAGGIYLLRTGSMPHVWDDFDPKTSPKEAFKAGFFGSDQGWMSYKLRNQQIGKWNRDSGLSKINWTPIGARRPPKDARIIFTNGTKPPWSAQAQSQYPWLKDHYYGL